MVVDSSSDTALSTAMLLELADFEVLGLNRAGDVMPAAASFRPDAILLDLSLGAGASGLDVARQIRTQPALRHALLVAVTGWSRPKDRVEAAACGFDHFMLKPAEPDRLVELVRAIERRKQSSPAWPAHLDRRGGKQSVCDRK